MLHLLLRFGAIGSFLAPLLYFGVSILLQPGYYGPLFSDPLGQWFVAGMVIWDLLGLGCCLLFPSTVVRVLVVIFFTIPLTMAVGLMPALLTIVKALGPILK